MGLARGQWTAASSKLGELVVPGRASKRLAELTIPSTSALSRLCHRQTEDPEREIYNGILSTQIKLVKGFSLTTSYIGLACQPVLLSYSSHANAAIILGAGAFLSFFTFATPLLIHTISKKYVTKLYYNQVEDKYTAVVYNLLLRPKRLSSNWMKWMSQRYQVCSRHSRQGQGKCHFLLRVQPFTILGTMAS